MRRHQTNSILGYSIQLASTLQKKKEKRFVHVYGEGAVSDQMCQKWFAEFLGTIDILAKQFFAVGLSEALEDV